jgi:uncharacterized ferritin-like protein (DUF455 family)
MTADSPAFADDPARDERFEVRQRWRDMVNLPADHPDNAKEFLHRQLNEELNSLEIAARNLADFPDEDWELRMSVARQCADEARHAIAFRRLLEARGGRVGQYPVLNFQYRIMAAIPSLLGRLAVANRSFEAAGMDAIQEGIESSRRRDDPEFIALFDAQLADEMQHVRFANVWVNRLIERDGPHAVLALARAVAHAEAALKWVAGGDIVFYPVADELRREAGFTEEEIASARKLVVERR